MYMDICELENIISKSVVRQKEITGRKDGMDVLVRYSGADVHLCGVAHHPWSLLVEAERWMRNELGIDGIHTIDDMNEWLDYMAWENDYDFDTSELDGRLVAEYCPDESKLIRLANHFLAIAKKEMGEVA